MHEPAQPQCACYATATSACPWPLPWPQPQPWPPAGFLRRAERGRLRPQAKEPALLNAAEQGDLATLKRLVEEGVDVNAKDGVRAAPPAAPPSPLRPFALRPRRPPPLLPRALAAAALPGIDARARLAPAHVAAGHGQVAGEPCCVFGTPSYCKNADPFL